LIKEILALDKIHLIIIDPEKTHLRLDKSNDIEGYVGLQTFDLKLSPQELDFLERLGFENNEAEDAMEMKLPVKGKRYLAHEGMAQYNSVLNETYKIKIHRAQTPFKEFEKVALTPITVVADTVLFIGERIILAPFGE
jgi:hypothetical protein